MLPSILLFLSGFSGLVYQVLWMRQLGLLFGNTSHATAVTLAAFFGGLAAGSWFWGRRSKAVENPMRTYAWLEAGIALTALLYFVVLNLFYIIYPELYQRVASEPLLLGVKFLLALLLVFPPAFLMGGTIPMIGQAVIPKTNELGVKAAWLYACNTIGAAAGAFAAAFLLVPAIGYTWTYITAVVVTGVVATLAGLLSKEQTVQPGIAVPAQTQRSALSISLVCFLSGFVFLTLEVLWTRLLAQIHVNSVYSFSAVLVIVLLALALGAAAASGLARRKTEPRTLLAGLLLLGGLSIALSPFIFMMTTEGFQMLDANGSMTDYLLALFSTGAITIGLPAFLLGIIFPFLMKSEESFARQAGTSIGRLSAINTFGAIAGSLLCGFVFLKHLGLWRTLQLSAALYLVAGLLLPKSWSKPTLILRGAGITVLVLLFTLLSPIGLRRTSWNPNQADEQILAVWETSDCTVSVVEDAQVGRSIKVNSNYRLGSIGVARMEHLQGRIPLLLFPKTESLFFIGVGTGISTGGALDSRFTSLKRIVACDLLPEVIEASRQYMTCVPNPETGIHVDFTCGLFTDKRVKTVAQDGRHYLMASGETFDMINADLFLPYQSGAGSLYSREHFASVKAALNPGGVFVQWLPMYQLTDAEFGSIARTLLEVFDTVTVWRNNFTAGNEILALMGHRDSTPLPACPSGDPAKRSREIEGKSPAQFSEYDLLFDETNALLLYCGNLTLAKDLFARYPLNTDDRPVIEYSSPRSMHTRIDGIIPTIVGPRYERFMDTLLANCPPDKDPMLANQTPEARKLVTAGAELYSSWLATAMEETLKANTAWARFVRAWTNQE